MARTMGKTRITVAAMLAAGKARLSLEMIAGEKGLDRLIDEAAVNRPGLALTGFLEHFAPRRVQILGNAEVAYLSALSESERIPRLERMFTLGIPCLVVTRRLRVFPELVKLANRYAIPVLRTPLITKNFINAATITLENLMAPRLSVQGTMVEILGLGVLLEGRPGVGKSEAALELVRMGHSLVADDMTFLRLDSSGALIGTATGVTRFHMEIRGLGIIHVPSLFGIASVRGEKKLDLLITLTRMDQLANDNRSGRENRHRIYLGQSIPHVELPVAPGRKVADLIETAALDQLLKRMGHDAAKELDDKLIETLTAGGSEASE
jgi:HPr kinase/phosphorylase